ncbi:MAG TPA: tetratricopeptide repeat protein [Candidatus Hydrogenedentes bacterium]|nr:tetratricopeptide repeat protein [Candidatus Hydrogenedentota bacterium]HOV72881.1 tetratricopeptide repeat protein [Candidatus Hydrogenedentota bacterium]HPC16418.1 tetratricopeptide repeat protein [Candidatus Hydrogenedentota bacterium]HRT20351.1 tetratricopeptide repeat protein [Candidatus Hydrogenedentota bacterium]HRT65077.1 tetratricopeptide repeat protein [Candidatus Hydrogenedentota bacterium]
MGASSVRYTVLLFKNLWVRAKRVAMGRESLPTALEGMRDDARKWAKTFEAPESADRRRRARALLRAGRACYNAGDFAGAEDRFREALTEDPRCALAATYLGHTLFRCGRLSEAKTAWKQAHDLDPDSEAGQKAMAALRGAEGQSRNVLAEMQERADRL